MAVAPESIEHRFARFLGELHEPGTAILSPRRFAGAMNQQLQQLAMLAGVHRNTIAQAPDSEAVQAYMRNAVKVIRAALDINGGDVYRALAWYRNHPIAALRLHTPEELVGSGRTDAVLEYLASIESGPLG